MEKRIVDGAEAHRSSGNVHDGLGLPDAEKLAIKTGLVVEIRKAIRRLNLTQQEAAKRMGITQPKISDMLRGDFSNLSERKPMDCLSRLGYDIEIQVRPVPIWPCRPTLAVARTSLRSRGLVRIVDLYLRRGDAGQRSGEISGPDSRIGGAGILV